MQKNILSKKLNLGLNFSTLSGGVASPSPNKGSMAQTHKLSQMDIQPGGVRDHFLQNVQKFGFGDWKNVYETWRLNPIFPKNWMCGWENGKKVYEKKGKQVFVLTNWRFIIKVLCI